MNFTRRCRQQQAGVARQRAPRRGEQRHRFDPVTVRAAARILRLAARGTVSPYEINFYLRELAASDGHSTIEGYLALRSMAGRQVERHDPGVDRAFRLRRERSDAATTPPEQLIAA